VSDAFSPIRYDGEKPPELLAEDRGDWRAEAERVRRERQDYEIEDVIRAVGIA